MKKKLTEELLDGDIIAEDIQRNDVLIVRAGTEINVRMRKKLIQWGIRQVAIRTEDEDDSQFNESLRAFLASGPVQQGELDPKEALRKQFRDDLCSIASEQRYGFGFNQMTILQELEHLFVSIMSVEAVYENMMALKHWDLHSYLHSLDVFMLGHLLGKSIGVSDLSNFSIGCLIHDIGKLKVPRKILNKREELTRNEIDQIQQHPVHGCDLVRRMGLQDEFATLAKSHHERLDGSGYPEGLHRDELDTRIRVLAIVDVFSALTLKRTYRDPIPAADALGMLLEDTGKFDANIVRSFAEALHIFPPGAKVMLSDGTEGVVTYADPYIPALPRMKMTDGRSIRIPISLSVKVSRFIDLEKDNLTEQ